MSEATATQQPITSSTESLEDVLAKLPKVEASPKEVLELKPNTVAEATSGPSEQVSQTAYVTWTKPDGSTFLAPLSNSETYERKGFSKGAEEEIDDLVAYHAEQAAKEATAAKPAAAKTSSKAASNG